MNAANEPPQDRASIAQAGFRKLNSIVEPAVMFGVANPLPLGSGAVVLETVGRKSGKKRRVPLLASRVFDKLIVSTVRSSSLWLKNIEADPAVTVYLYGKPRAATASVTRGPLNVVIIDLE